MMSGKTSHRKNYSANWDLTHSLINQQKNELKRFCDGTIISNGRKPGIQIMGRLQTNIFVQVGDHEDHEARMCHQPMVVDGLPCHIILSTKHQAGIPSVWIVCEKRDNHPGDHMDLGWMRPRLSSWLNEMIFNNSANTGTPEGSTS